MCLTCVAMVFAFSQPLIGASGSYPRVVYGPKETGGLAKARVVSSDRFGWVYVGDQRGLLRFDGQRWDRVYVGKAVRALIYDGKDTLFGLVDDGIGYWKIGATYEYEMVSLEQPILDQGLVSAGAFRDIAIVGDHIFATKTEATVRLIVKADRDIEVVVFKAQDSLPEEFKFRRVRLVDGRPLVGVENRQDPYDSRFGWLGADGKVAVQPSIKEAEDRNGMRLSVIDFVDAKLELPGCLLALAAKGAKRYLLKIKEGTYEEIGPWATEKPPEHCERPARIFEIANGKFILTTQGNGSAIVDSVGTIHSVITPPEIPGAAAAFHQDALGRFWFPASVGVVVFKTQPETRVWDFPEGSVLHDFAFFEGSLVVSTSHGVFVSGLSPDSQIPEAPFVHVTDHVYASRSIRVIGSRLFLCNKYGLHSVESLDELARPRLVAPTRAKYVLGVTGGAFENEIVVCYISHGKQRLRLVNGEWELVQHEPSPARVGHPFRDDQGNLWTLCKDHLDRATVQQTRFDTEGVMRSTAYDFDGVPVLMAGQVYLFTLEDTAGQESETFKWGVKRYDASIDSFADDDDLATQLRDELPSGFFPAAFVGDVTSANTGELLISGGTSSFFRLNRSANGKVSSECLVELEMPGLVTSSQVGPGDNVLLGVQNRLYCRLPSSASAVFDEEEPQVLLTRIALVGQEYDGSENASTPLVSNPESWPSYGRRDLDFDFTSRTLAISYAVPHSQTASNVLFQTKMVGISDQWSTPTRKSEREYAALKEGKYQFLVRAILPDGRTTDDSICNIVIYPLWYRTNVAKLALLCTGLVLTGGFVQWRVRQHKKQVATLKKEVADRVEAEEQLRITQQVLVGQERMRAMGEMAAGVAHDVNNALAPVSAFSELIVRSDEASEGIRSMAGHVLKSSQDAAAIIRRIQPLYWGEERRLEQVSIDSLVKEAVARHRELIQPNVGETAAIDIQVNTSPAVMWCSSTELREVLGNLLDNAVSAIAGKGVINVSCKADEQNLVVTVADDGVGMDNKTLESCFAAFFSTKGRYGSGLGLSTSRAILNSYGGDIEVESEEGHGTTFTFTIPIKQPSPGAISLIDAQELSGVMPQRMLLVDDIETTRLAIAALVESLGHRVVHAQDAEQAMTILEADDGIQIVLTDYGMPGKSGTWLCEQVTRLHSGVKVILMTGHELPAMRELSDAFLLKPVSVDALRHAIASISSDSSAAKQSYHSA